MYEQLFADDKVIAAGIPDEELLCDFCNEHVDKNLSPSNPACEGRWCDEAYKLWMEANE